MASINLLELARTTRYITKNNQPNRFNIEASRVVVNKPFQPLFRQYREKRPKFSNIRERFIKILHRIQFSNF